MMASTNQNKTEDYWPSELWRAPTGCKRWEFNLRRIMQIATMIRGCTAEQLERLRRMAIEQLVLLYDAFDALVPRSSAIVPPAAFFALELIAEGEADDFAAEHSIQQGRSILHSIQGYRSGDWMAQPLWILNGIPDGIIREARNPPYCEYSEVVKIRVELVIDAWLVDVATVQGIGAAFAPNWRISRVNVDSRARPVLTCVEETQICSEHTECNPLFVVWAPPIEEYSPYPSSQGF